jgi:hypothetical protein
VLSSRVRAVLTVAACAGCALGVALVVGLSGELSPGAHLAVLTAGAVVVGVGLARRTGAGSPPAGRTARLWLVCLGLALAGEAVALADEELPTVSDLLDPVLAPWPVRAAATLAWLVAGARLVTTPGATIGAAMRTTAGRIVVLAAWLWVGLHFLAR